MGVKLSKSSKKIARINRGPKSIKRINPSVTARIQAQYLSGLSLREIARVENCNKNSVHRIVREPEFQKFLENQREAALGLIPSAIESVKFALEHELNGKLGYQVLKDFGIIEKPSANISKCSP